MGAAFRDELEALSAHVQSLERDLSEANARGERAEHLEGELARANAEIARLGKIVALKEELIALEQASSTASAQSSVLTAAEGRAADATDPKLPLDTRLRRIAGQRSWWERNGWGTVAAGAFVLALGAGVGLSIFGLSASVHGTITSTGGKLGAWTIRPDSCDSGESNGFFGVNLFLDGDNRARFVHSESDGDKIVVFAAGANAGGLSARADACRLLRGEVHRQNSSVNRITNVEGKVDFDCDLGGAPVRGNITFSNCH